MDQVIIKYFKDLVTQLPFNDVLFRSCLESAGLFQGNLKEELKAKPTSTEKAEHFLDCKIKKDPKSFTVLLAVMEEFCSDSVRRLANKIREEIQQHCIESGHSTTSTDEMSEESILRKKKKLKLDDTDAVFKRCREYLKSCYSNRSFGPTKFSKIFSPDVYLDVTLAQSKHQTGGFHDGNIMDFANNEIKYVTIYQILAAKHKQIILIEGDSGAGKTTLAMNICKQWAEGNLLTEELVFRVPLRHEHFQKVTKLDEFLGSLRCPYVTEYARASNGENLVFILDGWDELPDHLRSGSFYHDIIFNKSALTSSTIIVTSRPSCSSKLADIATPCCYEISGFTLREVERFVNQYFSNNVQAAKSLINTFKLNDPRPFYSPITVAIICFMSQMNASIAISNSLSKLYKEFVLVWVNINKPSGYKNFTTVQDMLKELNPLFGKLCKVAFDMLVAQKVMFNEEQLKITEEELKYHFNGNMEQFDGYGLLHIEHMTDRFANKGKYYCFIHGAVQELLAAISIIESNSIEDTISEHFHEDSKLVGVFIFVFGLMSKEKLRLLVDKLKLKFIKSGRSGKLLNAIMYCLFEAHDEMLCNQFGQVFSQGKEINLIEMTFDSELQNFAYFLSVCGCRELIINGICHLNDDRVDIMAHYLCSTNTEIISFSFGCVSLSQQGMEIFVKVLTSQINLNSLKIDGFCAFTLNHIRMFYDIVCKYDSSIRVIWVYSCTLDKEDLELIGSLVATKSLNCLILFGSLNGNVPLKSSTCFCQGLCNTKSLQYFTVRVDSFSSDDIVTFGNILSKNNSIEYLEIYHMTSEICLATIFDALTLNKKIKRFLAMSQSVKYYELEQNFQRCLINNQALTHVGFTCLFPMFTGAKTVQWSSSQVCSICSGLQLNSLLVYLDISGCYIDRSACDAVCGMLSQNKTLQYLFLNPLHIEKQNAFIIIGSCRTNSTLELLSLVKWPDCPTKQPSKFTFATNEVFRNVMCQLQIIRRDKRKPRLKVVWEDKELTKIKFAMSKRTITSALKTVGFGDISAEVIIEALEYFSYCEHIDN